MALFAEEPDRQVPAPSRAGTVEFDAPLPPPPDAPPPAPYHLWDAPLGFTGRSSVLPREVQFDPHFPPLEDRWRVGFPEWDRYGKGHPPVDDYPYVPGHWWDPYNQNVLKGDYPIIGQNTFLAITAQSSTLTEYHQVPIADHAVREHRSCRGRTRSSAGRISSCYLQYFALSFDLFHGDARVSTAGLAHQGYADLELQLPRRPANSASSAPTCCTVWIAADRSWHWRNGSSRPSLPTSGRTTISSRSAPARSHLPATSAASSSATRTGRCACSAPPIPTAINSTSPISTSSRRTPTAMLNTFDNRSQQIVIANYYIQDFIFPGYTAEFSVHLQPRQPNAQVRQERLSGAAGPGRHVPAARARCRLSRLDRRRAHRPAQHQSRVLLGIRPRLAQPARQSAAGHQRRDGGAGAVLRLRLDSLPLVTVLGLGRSQLRPTATPPASTAFSTTPTSRAASSATGNGSRSACSASTSRTAAACSPTCAAARFRGRATSSIRASRSSTSARTWTSRRSFG